MRYRITLSYDGSSFCGWQVQAGAQTVQECLERALSTLLRTPVGVTGAGRTDTGVHAIAYIAHFDIEDVGAAVEPAELSYKLNAILPPSVVVHGIEPVAADFHARFDASLRSYTYFLHRGKDPFAARYSLRRDEALDFGAMNRAAALLVGRHDFACFQKTGTDVRTSVCVVKEAFWAPYRPVHVSLLGFGAPAPDPASLGPGRGSSAGTWTGTLRGMVPAGEPLPGLDGDRLETLSGLDGDQAEAWRYVYFRISADRFLRNMVRAIVGTLLEVGRGKRSVADFASLIFPVDEGRLSGAAASDGGVPAAGAAPTSLRSRAGDSVPGHALFLNRVEYPEP